MLEINEQNNTAVLISSLNRIFNQGRLNGKLSSINLYILNSIYKLLNNCCIELTQDQRISLMDLYRKLYFNSEEICHINNIQKYQIQPKITFIQAKTKDCNNYPIIDKIYYWSDTRFWEADYNLLIVEQAKNNDFLFVQNFETYSVFNAGFNWELIDGESRVMCINIYETQPNSIYELYNEFEENITSLFYYHYIEETNSILYIGTFSLNSLEYIKIKKIN